MFNVKKGIDSILGVETKTKGDIKTKGTIRIDGFFEGTLEADWIILGETAHLVGEINARRVLIGGKVEGRITAKEAIEIKPKGHMLGEVKTPKLIITEGGILEGQSSMHREESAVINFQKKKEEL